MLTCVPIRDLKDTAKFSALVEASHEPIIVTRNGYEAFVVMRPDEYEAMQLEISRARLLSRIAQAEHEFENGEYDDANDFIENVKRSHGL